MSKYVGIQTQFKNKDCLLEALKALGYPEIEVGENIPLKSYQDEDRFDADGKQVTAEIVVRKKHVGFASNDLGFKLEGGFYTMLVSEYDVGNNVDPVKIKSAYADAVITKYTSKLGFKIVSKEGNKIIARRW